MIKNISFSLLFLGFFSANSQKINIKCADNYVKANVTAATGSYENTRTAFFNQISTIINKEDQPEGVVYKIPVVVHVIYETPEDNISREQVLDAIRVINRDYRRVNADTVNTRSVFKPVAADVEVEFVLAKLDEQGNCTEGITRTYSTLTASANDNVKPLAHWDNKKYLNIWVVRNISVQGKSNILGYAYKPVGANQNYINDGIVIRHDQMGEIGTAVSGGRTLTHEAGHYFGLDHPFEYGCFVNNGDFCADTPPVDSANYGCNLGINSCMNDSPDLPDQVENYMDYSDDACANMFTQDQKSIVRASLSIFNLRGSLISNANLQFTGIASNQVLPCAPLADFDADQTLICEGESIQFYDKTFMGNPTSYAWTFSGGSPATSTAQNPIVNYAAKGNYDVNLIVTNANGSTNTLKRGYVSVRSQTNTPYVNAFADGFDQYPIPNLTWHVEPGIDKMNFGYFYKTSYAGQSCVTLQNLHAAKGETDAMITHTISLANSKDAQLSFWYAFADRNPSGNDALKVFVSNDCGKTWSLEGSKVGLFLRTTNARVNDTVWYPTLASQWKQMTVDLNTYALGANAIMIKIEFTAGGGNCFYLDEMFLATTIGMEELFAENGPKIYPNPAHDVVTVELPQPGGTLKITDITGRIVLKKQLATTEKVTSLQTHNFAPGLYLITIEQNGKLITRKIVIQ